MPKYPLSHLMLLEEVAWLVPLLAPLIVGFIIGALVKRALKLALLVMALVAALATFGYISVPSLREVAEAALTVLPRIWSEMGPFINVLPYSSITFLIGLTLGLWKS